MTMPIPLRDFDLRIAPPEECRLCHHDGPDDCPLHSPIVTCPSCHGGKGLASCACHGKGTMTNSRARRLLAEAEAMHEIAMLYIEGAGDA